MFIDPHILERARLEQLLANTTPHKVWTPEEYEARVLEILAQVVAIAEIEDISGIADALRALSNDIEHFLQRDAPRYWHRQGLQRSVVDAVLEEVCARFQEAIRLLVFRLSEKNLRVTVTERTVIKTLEDELMRISTALGDADIGLDIHMDCDGDEELAHHLQALGV